MKFNKLINNITNIKINGNINIDIIGIENDSRKIKNGFLFAALKGLIFDGENFIKNAINLGAVAILVDIKYNTKIQNDIVWIKSSEPRKTLAYLAANFYQNQPPFILAVTGTNGKSSIVNFLYQIFSKLGKKTASIGTLGVNICGVKKDDLYIKLNHTSPDPITLHRILSKLVKNKVEYLAIEASSHGLKQNRIHGIKLYAAAFTNLTFEHLDYHLNMEEYFQVKMTLFTELLPKTSQIIILSDKPYSDRVFNTIKHVNDNIKTIGFRGNYIKLLSIKIFSMGQRVQFLLYDKVYKIDLPLIGIFQVENIFIAIGLLLSIKNIKIEYIIKIIKEIKGVNGRLEYINSNSKGGQIFVDFAHTPDSLKNVLISLKLYLKKLSKLIVIFGCGGDRDKDKRYLMGKIANQYADIIIVTDDNPRFENANKIRFMIKKGCPNAIEIANRTEAISYGISLLKHHDILIIAGKGHEEGQLIKGKIIGNSDRFKILKCLKG